LKIAFYTHTLSCRGGNQALLDYAKYNQEILGNESVIVQTAQTEDGMLRDVAKRFKVRTIPGWADLNRFAADFDAVYAIKAGFEEPPIIDSTKFLVHAVFQFYFPHGDVYAYVSEWLADWMVACGYPRQPFVPHIVNIPQPNMEDVEIIRNNLGISKDQFVVGRLGGFDTFDLPFVHQAIIDTVNKRDDMVFALPYTKPFYEHKNIKYLPQIWDRQMKSNYIGLCDAMINGREQGETFGLANAEFLYLNKPVMAWEEGKDRAHIRMLQPFGTLYNLDNVYSMLNSLPDRPKRDYTVAVAPYTPEKVMKQFKEVFLS
jgi:hypothetical protein